MLPQIHRIVELGDLHTWEIVSDRVSLIRRGFKRPGKNERTSKIKAIYVACASYLEAVRLQVDLSFKLNVNSARIFIRRAERSLDWEWEVKIQGDFLLHQVVDIAEKLDSLHLVKEAPTAPCVLSREVVAVATKTTPLARAATVGTHQNYWSKRLPNLNTKLSLSQRRAIASYV